MRWAILVGAALAVAGCGSQDGPERTGGTETVTASPGEATMTEQPGAGGVDPITETDDGARIPLAVGSEIPWRLSSEWDWDQPVADGYPVELVPVDYLVDPGYREWLVVGASPGTAVLSVRGTGACGDPQACPDRVVTLTVDVDD
jgi:hypothetical protein